ncbi:MAG TPA: hypothetical protein GX511_02740 [Firmicutes bacterium]|nr:hypothetical protein [Bacillota bacterium]
MQTLISVALALGAGYAGGWLAGRQARRRDAQMLRSEVETLLSELTLAAAQASEQVVRERRRLEGLIKAARATQPEAPCPPEQPTDAAGGEKAAAEAEAGLQENILALAGAGQDPTTIAQRLGLGRGEVELILNLKRLESQPPAGN